MNCSCGAEQKFEEEREEERVHQFLMGLDDSRFGGVCSGIIASDSALDIGEVYAKIIREEQRLLLKRDQEQQQSAIGFTTRYDTPTQSSPARGSTESNQNRPRQGSLLCSHCGRSGHEKSNYWQLVGFPDWWEERSSGRGAGRGGNRGGRRDKNPSGGKGRGAGDYNQNKAPGKAHATTSNASVFPEFTTEQWNTLT